MDWMGIFERDSDELSTASLVGVFLFCGREWSETGCLSELLWGCGLRGGLMSGESCRLLLGGLISGESCLLPPGGP